MELGVTHFDGHWLLVIRSVPNEYMESVETDKVSIGITTMANAMTLALK